MQITLSEKNRLNLNITGQNKYPDILQLAPGYFITGLSTLYRGLDSLSSKSYFSGQLFYSHIDLTRRGLLFFTGISLSQTPYLEIPDVFPNPLYSYSRDVSTSKVSGIFSSYTRIEQLLPKIHLRISPELTVSTGKMYSMIADEGFFSRFFQLQSSLNADYSYRNFQLTVESGYLQSSQRRLDAPMALPTATTSQWVNRLKVTWKTGPRLFFDATGRLNVIYPSGQKSEQLLMTNAAVTYHTKNEKWVVGLTGNNLLNRTSFAESIVAPSSTTNSGYSIFHRVVMASLQLNF